MLGTFQHSSLRIEVDAAASDIRESLIAPSQFKCWLWPQRFTEGLPDALTLGQIFKSSVGPIEIQHEVKAISDTHLHLLMSGGVDGFHEWHWGDGWVQTRLEGVSVLPLNLAQSLNLWRLKQFLSQPKEG
ncbi:hypothetical protein [Pseudanabaena sp. FACHB-2040]|uniref:hypothetical protein n=1 Tax=Pseudanabaena sp. FACHB-2040 TaxID=2692859 RepID=UPI0016868868|nr:hypothetical protein [Pseudanabaena sp. FACHB-2040]MBD2259816.1 hypothetical protein [Pseudanabaena sp. FACHB-2040]